MQDYVIKAFVVGISGKMGLELVERAKLFGVRIMGGLDVVKASPYPTFSRVEDVDVSYDVVIDFSRPSTLDSVIYLCKKENAPCVIATTGYTAEEEQKILELSKDVPVFKSANMSVGVNVLAILAEKAAMFLKGYNFDIELIEKHHNKKVDAPSGTAKMLCRAIEGALDRDPKYRYGRSGNDSRMYDEIGIHSVRGGTIVGEHEIMFCGNHETITLSHSAESRSIFADGALQAALWITTDLRPGLYDMHDLLFL